ncbi:MAG TPA: GGDEF domain-containing protein [Candidatus Eisenbacteria bacterium]|jgi:diguanylate cyclase (GGDEF)-like protein
MRRKHIDFRELLERLLPLEELPPADRGAVERALKSGVSEQLEQAALYALQQLERVGALRRLPPARNGGAPLLRYQPRDGMDVITIQLPGAARRDGVVSFPRAGLPPQAQASLEHVRRLLWLEDERTLTDPRGSRTRLGLLPQLARVGADLLGGSEVRLVPAVGDPAGPSAALESELGSEAAAHPEILYYCPDLQLSARLAKATQGRGMRSAVFAGLPHGGEEPLGHLEVLGRGADAFGPDDLARVALLADTCGATMERAARLAKVAFIDPLTAVYNRSYFDLEVRNEMARSEREQSSLALCIVDIDDFKRFNTLYGYEAGNEVLAHVAQTLKRGVRPFDTVARWGGEEFAVLLTSPIHAADVTAISERLRLLVERQTVELEGLDRRSHRVGVTVSIGVAVFPEHGTEPAGLWRGANQALLAAKRPPKNRVVFFEREAGPSSRG